MNFLPAIIRRRRAPSMARAFVGILSGFFNWSVEHINDTALQGRGAYKRSPTVATCVDQIADAASSVPLKVYTEKTVDGKIERQEVVTGELYDLLRKANPYQTMREFWRDLIAEYVLMGNAFILCRGTTENGPPNELQVMDVSEVGIAKDKQGYPAGYKYGVEGKLISLRDVIHLRKFNPENRWWGMSPTEILLNPILSSWYIDRLNIDWFKRGGIPPGILTTDHILSDPEAKGLQDRWMAKHGGMDKKHDIAVMSSGLKFQIVGVTHKDMEFEGQSRWNREMVLMLFGVPPVVAGDLQHASYANAKEQKRQFWEMTVIPTLCEVKGIINEIMIPRFWPSKGWIVEHDLSQVPELQEDANAKATRHQIYITTGTLTVNEVRTDLNREPVPWGDEPPAAPSPFGAMLGDKAPAMFKSLRDDEPDPVKEKRVALWKAFDRKLTIRESTLEKQMREFFKDQKKRLLEGFGQIGRESAVSFSVAMDGRLVRDPVRPINVDEVMALFVMAVEMAKLKGLVGPTIEEFLKLAGQEGMVQAGVDLTFNMADPRVIEWVEQKTLNLVTTVHDTSKDKLRRILTQAVEEGKSINETAKGIGELFDGFDYRAKRIARTEVISAHNNGSIEGYRQSDAVEGKEWLVAAGAQTPRHELYAGLDGQVRALDAPFDVQGSLMQYPGDPAGGAEDVINCRCTVLPVLKENDDGE